MVVKKEKYFFIKQIQHYNNLSTLYIIYMIIKRNKSVYIFLKMILLYYSLKPWGTCAGPEFRKFVENSNKSKHIGII